MRDGVSVFNRNITQQASLDDTQGTQYYTFSEFLANGSTQVKYYTKTRRNATAIQETGVNDSVASHNLTLSTVSTGEHRVWDAFDHNELRRSAGLSPIDMTS